MIKLNLVQSLFNTGERILSQSKKTFSSFRGISTLQVSNTQMQQHRLFTYHSYSSKADAYIVAYTKLYNQINKLTREKEEVSGFYLRAPLVFDKHKILTKEENTQLAKLQIELNKLNEQNEQLKEKMSKDNVRVYYNGTRFSWKREEGFGEILPIITLRIKK
jgi:hypothetical protein